jgi:hypothetical protein
MTREEEKCEFCKKPLKKYFLFTIDWGPPNGFPRQLMNWPCHRKCAEKCFADLAHHLGLRLGHWEMKK